MFNDMDTVITTASFCLVNLIEYTQLGSLLLHYMHALFAVQATIILAVASRTAGR